MGNNFLNLFIARRISFSAKSRGEKIMVRVATISVAISVATMIIAICVVVGFKSQIEQKVVGFASHYKVVSLDARDEKAIEASSAIEEELSQLPYVKSVTSFTQKGGVLNHNGSILGVLFKGVDKNYNFDFLNSALIAGEALNLESEEKSKDILISNYIAKKLGIEVGDKVRIIFQSDATYNDVLSVVGIYETSLEEFDQKLIVGDMRTLDRVIGKENRGKISGYEIFSDDLEKVDQRLDEVENIVFDAALDKEPLMIVPVTEEFITIFDWLKLQNINILIVIIIMILVSAFNMIAVMLIVLIDKSAMIGTLKALGIKNRALQQIFLFRSLYIVSKGVVYGTLLSLLLCYIQIYFKPLKLSESGYFLSYVPVEINYLYICAVILITFVSMLIFETIPVRIISKMSPHKSIKFN